MANGNLSRKAEIQTQVKERAAMYHYDDHVQRVSYDEHRNSLAKQAKRCPET